MQISEGYYIKSRTVDSYISRSLKCKDIVQLRNGLYVTMDFYDKNKGDVAYKYYLANITRTPSYVSSWTALQYYGLTTEIVNTITSVTKKVTREYATKAGTFSYNSIKSDLFSGFLQVSGKFEFFIATPAKALFDLLYFKTNQFKGITFDVIDSLVEGVRVDFDEMEEKDKVEFYKLVKKQLNIAQEHKEISN